MSKNIALKILEHPDKDEIITKLLSGVSVADIHEWLEAKYVNVGEKKFALSDKIISTFQKEYLDIYSIIKEDIAKTKTKLSSDEDLKIEIQGTPQYRKILEKYASDELDIKVTVKKMVATIETRIEQIFDQIQEDPRNIKMDRTLIEWFNSLTALVEKYDTILNGSPDQINIQNNINIQILDNHINLVHNLITEILSKLDYDTSLLFIEMFNEGLQKLNIETAKLLPQEVRMTEAKVLSEVITNLDKQ